MENISAQRLTGSSAAARRQAANRRERDDGEQVNVATSTGAEWSERRRTL